MENLVSAIITQTRRASNTSRFGGGQKRAIMTATQQGYTSIVDCPYESQWCLGQSDEAIERGKPSEQPRLKEMHQRAVFTNFIRQ